MKMNFPIVLFFLSATAGVAQIRKYVYAPSTQQAWLQEYVELVSIPNVLGDSVNMERNAAFISEMMHKRGIKTTLLRSGKAGSAPVVYGEVNTPGARTTLAFYAHYDGQPVNPQQWAEGLSPFTPALYSKRLDQGGTPVAFPAANQSIDPTWRLYGRSSADDKAGVFAIIAAYEAIVKNKLRPTVNLKFFFEGEEEAGSVHLDEIFQNSRSILQADLWVICDGPRHISGRKQVLFGVRGDVNVDLTVYGSKRPLHSGNYGNWAPNPAMRLAQLLASMKDDNGMVTIKGFYDDVTPLTEPERKAMAAIPPVEEDLKRDLALSKPDGDGKSLMELMTLPTLNINGMQSGNVGALAANVIPTEANAVLDLRLVLGNDVDRQIAKVVAHVESKGYKVLDRQPTDEERISYPLIATLTKRGRGYNAQRTPMDLPLAARVVDAVGTTVVDPVIAVPSLGGSLPLFLFEQYLNTKPITIPVVNYDNNQHAENENVMLQYLWEGIETMAAVMRLEQTKVNRSK
ncbi:MAG TPA: M20/M25/M40 family metallo-hydrolase [Chryseolinea sp.]|nr:M20/M25/M40 family metallo-hydrolase [Chryseolinea sp.]